MSKRRRSDPSQTSLLDLISEPEPPTVGQVADNTRTQSAKLQSPKDPATKSATHRVYVPRLWSQFSALFAMLSAVLFFLPPQEAMSLSLKIGIALIVLALALILLPLGMMIPSKYARRIYRIERDRRRALLTQGILVIPPVVSAALLVVWAINIAGDEFKNEYDRISTQWQHESNKRDWQNKTKTLPAQGSSSKNVR